MVRKISTGQDPEFPKWVEDYNIRAYQSTRVVNLTSANVAIEVQFAYDMTLRF